MESKFHRWWLGSCVAAVLLASWAGGFSVAVTAVFVVIYLTGATLVGQDDVADIGLSADDEAEPEVMPAAKPAVEVKAAPEVKAEPVAIAAFHDTADDDAEPYPDDDDLEAAPSSPPAVVETEETDETGAAAVVVQFAEPADNAIVVEVTDPVDTAAIVDIVESDDAEQTEAMIIEGDADEPEPSPA